MRGGDDSEASIADEAVNEDEILTGEDLAQEGGRRRRRRRRSMRGGDYVGAPASSEIENNPGTNMFGGRRRRRRSMRGGEDSGPVDPDTASVGGMYDPPAESGDSAKMSKGGRRRRRGGGIIATAALPFGLFGLQRLFQGRNKGKTHRRR